MRIEQPGPTRFTQLSDVPQSFLGASLKTVSVNLAETALTFTTGGGGGATTFIQLTDVPNSYVGQSLKAVRVNAGATGLEFFTLGGGTGTVTDFIFTNVNGISGSVTTSTTTPTLSLSLGAITPTSVAASGTVTGSNLSGTNTGDQTITLTGEVTGSGTSSFGTTVANSTVIGKVLTGLSLVTSQVIAATDSVVLAFGYLQAQITALTTTVGTKVSSVSAGTNVTVTGTATVPVINAPTMTATVGGAVPTPPNNTTTFLRGDGTFAIPAGGALSLYQDSKTVATNTSVTADYSAIVTGKYKINSGLILSIGSGATLRIL